VAEFARVFKAQHRIEECLRRAKGEAGLADYQVRTWAGWHHHQTLKALTKPSVGMRFAPWHGGFSSLGGSCHGLSPYA
jgi:SRSO17 transposase